MIGPTGWVRGPDPAPTPKQEIIILRIAFKFQLIGYWTEGTDGRGNLPCTEHCHDFKSI